MDFRHRIAVQIRLLADCGQAASEPLQFALLLEGQAQYVPPDPDAGIKLPTLRW